MRRREFTTQEVCAAALGCIERLNLELNAVIGFDRQAASSESHAADERVLQFAAHVERIVRREFTPDFEN